MKKINDNTYLIEGNLYTKGDIKIYPDACEKITLHVRGEVVACVNEPNNLDADLCLNFDDIGIKFNDIIAFSNIEINHPEISVFTPL